MTGESSDSGLDELMRLSQQMNKQEHEATQREEQGIRQRKKVQSILGEQRKFSISVAVRQLQSVASPETIEQVNALKGKQGTAELHKLIGSLAYDLEKHISIIAVANPDIKPIERSVQTLSILVELLPSLE